ncbi:MAG: GDSL-type esterase/lipase family protein [Acidimicrobiales bacterium]
MVLLVALAAVVCGGSIALALTVTPESTVTAAGQTVSVGAAAPSLSFSGPGQLDLFGQQLPTTVRFDGPVRPRLVLQRITIDSQVASLFNASRHPAVAKSLGRALATGWKRYFVWEVLVTGGCALALIAAFAGWWRVPWRRVLLLMGVGLVLVEGVDLGAVMVAAYGAPATLSRVGSLESLVGRTTLTIAADSGAPPPPAQVAVLGDSTAAGLGNPLVADPTPADRACGRSADSYARDLAAADGWQVVNLACSGATVQRGLLGSQLAGGQTVPAQLSVAKREQYLSTVIVSVGANDVGWSAMLRACAVAPTCDNSAFTAYFQQQLQSFATNYLQLLQELAALRGHPLVVVNLYYNPFDPDAACLAHLGMTHRKEKAVSSMLDALNGVLAKGATGPPFVSVQPSFAGHALCDPQPYVQGPGGQAPFHPTASGELAIALADQQAVLSHRGAAAAHKG